MKEQRRKFTILNLSLVSRESLLRANVQPEKKLRDVNFKDRRGLYAPSTLKSPIKGSF
jgi:hypothetical protein